MCSTMRQGFNIYVALPGESLQSSNNLRADLSEDIQIMLKPKLFTTLKAIHSYNLTQRGCFLKSERQLRFFKIYTARNCFVKCLANFTKRE